MVRKLKREEKLFVIDLLKQRKPLKEVQESLKKEFGIEITTTSLFRYKEELEISGYFDMDLTEQDWFKQGEKLNDIEIDMLDVVHKGYKLIKEWLETLNGKNISSRDVLAITNALKQAEKIHDKLVIPNKRAHQKEQVSKEILG